MIGFLRKGKHQFQSVTDLAKITCKYFYGNTIEKSIVLPNLHFRCLFFAAFLTAFSAVIMGLFATRV